MRSMLTSKYTCGKIFDQKIKWSSLLIFFSPFLNSWLAIKTSTKSRLSFEWDPYFLRALLLTVGQSVMPTTCKVYKLLFHRRLNTIKWLNNLSLVVEKLPGLLGGGVGPTEVLDPTLDLSDDAASWVIRHFWKKIYYVQNWNVRITSIPLSKTSYNIPS